MAKAKIPRLYIILYGRFKFQVGNGNIISIKDIHYVLGDRKIPKNEHIEIIRECLEEYSLLKRINRDNFELSTIKPKKIPCDHDGIPLFCF